MATKVVPAERREELLSGLAGQGLEVGAGTGAAFSFYPTRVTALTAIEPEPTLRSLALEAAARAPIAVTVTGASAEATGLPDASCDFVVCSLVLCSVDDVPAALAELRRVLKPGGELRFYEHVKAPNSLTAAVQSTMDRSGVWPALAGGCHLARDTERTISLAGFEIESIHRFTSGPRSVGVPFLLGRARRD